jgi:hypothetical protein
MTTDRASRREPGAVVLLGDSILDNGAYTGGGPNVAAQLQAALPPGWRAVLAAVDGATIEDVPRQMGDAPPDAAVLVLSAGGNDLLMHSDGLDRPATGTAQVLASLMARNAAAAMAVFDDRILRVALEKRLPAIELRAVCSRPEDYANPIEPSSVAARRSPASSPAWWRSTTSARGAPRCSHNPLQQLRVSDCAERWLDPCNPGTPRTRSERPWQERTDDAASGGCW